MVSSVLIWGWYVALCPRQPLICVYLSAETGAFSKHPMTERGLVHLPQAPFSACVRMSWGRRVQEDFRYGSYKTAKTKTDRFLLIIPHSIFENKQVLLL